MNNNNDNNVHAELESTFSMIKCAFPHGIVTDDYVPLLFVLAEEMSHRNIARVISLLTSIDYYTVLNDVYRVLSTDVLHPEDIVRVKQQLILCGYQAWIQEDK